MISCLGSHLSGVSLVRSLTCPESGISLVRGLTCPGVHSSGCSLSVADVGDNFSPSLLHFPPQLRRYLLAAVAQISLATSVLRRWLILKQFRFRYTQLFTSLYPNQIGSNRIFQFSRKKMVVSETVFRIAFIL
jgi:hypothetical protein